VSVGSGKRGRKKKKILRSGENASGPNTANARAECERDEKKRQKKWVGKGAGPHRTRGKGELHNSKTTGREQCYGGKKKKRYEKEREGVDSGQKSRASTRRRGGGRIAEEPILKRRAEREVQEKEKGIREKKRDNLQGPHPNNKNLPVKS